MKNNQLQLVSFEQAKKLKELGFDYPCRAEFITRTDWKTLKNYYEVHDQRTNSKNFNASKKNLSAPEIALVFQWLRNEKGIEIEISSLGCEPEKYKWAIWENGTFQDECLRTDYEDYETTESIALDKALQLLEEK